VFLFDDLHLSPEDLALSRQAGAKAVTEILTDSDIAAVVSTSGQTNSGLTQDRAKLQAAIMNLRPSSRYRSMDIGCPYFDYYLANLAVNLHDSQAIQEANNEASCMPSVGGQMGGQPQTIAQVAEQATTSQQQAAPSQEVEHLSGKAMAKAMYELERGQTAVRETYAIMGQLAGKMANLPGQRTLILVSPGMLPNRPRGADGSIASHESRDPVQCNHQCHRWTWPLYNISACKRTLCD
jgi:hypothetical protein